MVVAVGGDVNHPFHADVPRAHEGVAVQARAARRGGIVVVDELEELLVVLRQALDIVQRVVSAGEDVARINADAQARILELEDELHEVGVGRESLGALTCRCLQQDRTAFGGVLECARKVGAHVLDGLRQLLVGGLTHVDHHALTANGVCVLEVLDEQARMVVVLLTGLSAEINNVLAVNEQVQLGLVHRGGSGGELIVGNTHLGVLRSREEDLNGLRTDLERHIQNGAGQRLLLGGVKADEVELTQEGARERVLRLVRIARRCRRVQESGELGAVGPGAQVRVPDELLERQHQIGVCRLRRKRTVGEELVQKADPVLLHLTRHLDLKELSVCARIRVTLDGARSDDLIVAQRTLRHLVHLAPRSDNVVQKRLRGLGLAYLVQRLCGQSGVPLECRDAGCLNGHVGGGQPKQFLRDVAELRIAFLLLEDGEQGVRVAGIRSIRNLELRREELL